MSMHKTIEYKDSEIDVKLTVSSADVTIGMMRTLLIGQSEQVEPLKEGASDIEVLRHQAKIWARSFLYPSLTAAVTEQQGFDHWPLLPEEFTGLPEPLVIQWEAATFELNPHWRSRLPETEEEVEEAQKKVISTT